MNQPLEIRQRIITLHSQGLSQRTIARCLLLSQTAVSRVVRRFKKNTACIPARKIGSGGKFVLSKREIRRLKMISTAHPHYTAAQIQSSVGGNCLKCSIRTIQRYLRRVGCFPYRPAKSPALSGTQKKRRHLWALQHETFDWSNVVFSDETYICLETGTPNQYVRRQKGQKIALVHTKQHKPFYKKLLVWACIDSSGPGPIVIFRGSMDSIKYARIIEEHVVPFASEMSFFQQDNAPPHKAKNVLGVFESNDINLLDWPPYSPDANCIENAWAILKQRVRSRQSTSLEELESNILDVWQNDASFKKTCCDLVSKMSKRVSALLNSRGGFTKY